MYSVRIHDNYAFICISEQITESRELTFIHRQVFTVICSLHCRNYRYDEFVSEKRFVFFLHLLRDTSSGPSLYLHSIVVLKQANARVGYKETSSVFTSTL